MFDYENSATETIEGIWRQHNTPTANLYPFTQVGHRFGADAKDIGEEFAEYFETEFKILTWQDSVV